MLTIRTFSFLSLFSLVLLIVSSLTASAALTDGVAGYWRFDDGTGTSARDSSGNGRDGDLLNGPVWSPGKVNSSLLFDGVNDYVSLGSGSNFSTLCIEGCSFGGWVKPARVPSTNYNTIIARYDYSYSDMFFSLSYDRHSRIEGLVGRDGGLAQCISTSGYVFNYQEWQHIIGVFNGSALRLYRNGEQIALTLCSFNGINATAWRDSEDTFIGTFDTTSKTGYINASLDEILLFNRSLDSTEVRDLYTNGLTLIASPANDTINTTSSNTSSSSSNSSFGTPFGMLDVDLYLDFEAGTYGDVINASYLDSVTHGVPISWMSVFNMTVSDRYHNIAVPVSVGGQQYANGTRSLNHSHTESNALTRGRLPAEYDNVSLGFFINTGLPVLDYGDYDLFELDSINGQSSCVLAYRDSHFKAHTIRPSTHGDLITISPNTWYWITIKWARNASCYIDIYDAENWSLVGSSVSGPLGDNAALDFRFGGYNHGLITQANTYYDNIIFDLTDATFPLGIPTFDSSNSSQQSFITLMTNVAGLFLSVDSSSQLAPYTFSTMRDTVHTLFAATTQMVGNQTYRFASWSDEGNQTHSITAGVGNVTYTATYVPVTAILPRVSLDSGAVSIALTGSLDYTNATSSPLTTQTSWSKVAGPGSATFVNSSALNTTVFLSAKGAYTLRLTVDDGFGFTNTDLNISIL